VVIARCDSDNLPSIRTLERLGFTRTGESDVQIAWRSS
jgi:RimJ/RimL family protein N-acetyltransferase